VGRRADFLLTDDDPTTDIRATTRIRHVWSGGIQLR
jgi:imidazolonepropionase-like amidohydrolase